MPEGTGCCTNSLTILFSGMIAADPEPGGRDLGGPPVLLGFRRLGHDVFFVESIPDRRSAAEKLPAGSDDNAALLPPGDGGLRSRFRRPHCCSRGPGRRSAFPMKNSCESPAPPTC